jgi:hypothetical protein
MPTLRQRVTATTANALANSKFAVVPQPGAVLNMWAAGVTATDDVGLSIGAQEIIPAGTDINIEASADVLDTDRDQIIYNEVIPAGQLFLPVTVTTEMQFLISLKYL